MRVRYIFRSLENMNKDEYEEELLLFLIDWV